MIATIYYLDVERHRRLVLRASDLLAESKRLLERYRALAARSKS